MVSDDVSVFTGLVAGVGRVVRSERAEEGVRVTISSPLAGELREGDSVAVNGVCLTATSLDGDSFAADVMNETLRARSLRGLGRAPPSTSSSRCARATGSAVTSCRDTSMAPAGGRGRAGRVRPASADRGPGELLRYVIRKGSIAVDGVSLTVADVDDQSFTVSLIPETLQRTNLGAARLVPK